MNCTDIHQHLDDYLDGQLNKQDQLAFLGHVEGCDTCQHTLHRAQELQLALATMPAPPMRGDVLKHAMQEARNGSAHSKAQRSRHWFAAGFGGAMAAGVLVFLMAGPMNNMLADKTPVNEITMQLSEPRQLNVVFKVPEAMNNVVMELQLSDGLQLANRPGQKTFRWQTSLKQGKNSLPLSVEAKRAGQAKIVARIIKDGKQKVFHLNLKVEKGSLSSVMKVEHWI